MEEYLDAKLALFNRMTGEDTALMHESLRDVIKDRSFTNAHVQWFDATDRFEAPQSSRRAQPLQCGSRMAGCQTVRHLRISGCRNHTQFQAAGPPHRTRG
ncbi:hypothetical protein [uncultured Pseudodesulfovibrio sp.]|uniref:hypothetical protein n=1 Tax=uncultured Pseudodesulfovibrio sp. TaxID=2035858 RepID=UPI0029C6ED8C|nr:hypothetical protein [uncultured Pseudodesulfovibrio sp.]